MTSSSDWLNETFRQAEEDVRQLPEWAKPVYVPGEDAVCAAGERRYHNCRFEYCTAPTGECPNPE